MAFPLPFGQPQPQQAVMPRVPWSQNPAITMAGIGLLSGRNLNEGFASLAQTVPAGMVAKSSLQAAMQKRQDDDAAKAAQRAAWNAGMKWKSGIELSPEDQAALAGAPEIASKFMPTTADLPNSVQEYQYGQTHPDYNDWRTSMSQAGAPKTVGTPPPGYAVKYDGAGNPVSMEPIKGGPADTSKSDAARQEQQSRYGDVVLEDIQRAKEKVKNQSWYAPVTGLGGQMLKGVGGSAATDTAELIQSINSSIAFDRLQAMREASPTGGALGAVSERELGLLQSTLGSLSQAQSQDQLMQNLDRLEKIYSGIMEKAAAYPNAAQFGFGGSGKSGPDPVYVSPSGVKVFAE